MSLFRAKTEEELKQLEEMEVAVVTQAIGAYREVVVSPEFRELERLRFEARSNEASALANAERKAEQRADEKWKGIVDEQAALIAELRAQLGEKK